MLSTLIVALAATIYLYLLPGLALLDLLWTRRDLDWGDRVGLAAGLSVVVYPIILLASYVVGIAPGAALAWTPGSVGLLILAANWGRRRTHPRADIGEKWDLAKISSPDLLPPLLLLGSLLLLLGIRLWSVREMVAPAWGDSVQHTFIVQLILDHGGLFQSWQPYAPMATMTYHFGFHTNVAVWAWLTGLGAPMSMIQAGQALNVLAVLVLYTLGKRLGGSAWAGLGAAVVAGFLFPLPGFYVNWGRYTQLTGQIVLIPAVWFVDVWWQSKERPAWPGLILLGTLILGIGLSHYRVTLFLGSAAVAWTLWSVWPWRGELKEWAIRLGQLILAGGVAGLLFLPWLQVVLQGKLARIATGIMTDSVSADGGGAAGEIALWRLTDGYFPAYFWKAALVTLVLALIWRRKLAVPLILWAGLTFLMTNPHLFGLPGDGLISNFHLLISIYIAIGLLLGWVASAGLLRLPDPRWRSLAGLMLLAVVLILGIPKQAHVVDPKFQMVTPEDLQTLAWADAVTPPESRFLVNGFLIFGDSSVAGSDAGWWLSYYTRRTSTVPPMLYLSEALDSTLNVDDPRRVVADVRASQGESAALADVLCREKITHIYLGQRRGSVAFEPGELIPGDWLVDKPYLTLAKRVGLAQVWSFDRSICGGE